MLLPAPAGLQDDPADNCASQSNLLVLAERVGDHRFRAPEIADFDAPDGPLGGRPYGLGPRQPSVRRASLCCTTSLALHLAAKGLQAVGQLARVAHRDHVTAIDLVDLDAQPLAGDPSLEVEREHPIVAAC